VDRDQCGTCGAQGNVPAGQIISNSYDPFPKNVGGSAGEIEQDHLKITVVGESDSDGVSRCHVACRKSLN